MAGVHQLELPPDVRQAARHRILDSLGAVVSGGRLKAGEMAIKYTLMQGGYTGILSADHRHQDLGGERGPHQRDVRPTPTRTDDFEPVTKSHPGCSVIPAALAMARAGENSSGMDFLRAVVLGYDLCCRFLLALGPDLGPGRAPQRGKAPSSTMGSAAAAAALAGLDETGMRYILSYAAQQGVWHLELAPRCRARRKGLSIFPGWVPATASPPL